MKRESIVRRRVDRGIYVLNNWWRGTMSRSSMRHTLARALRVCDKSLHPDVAEYYVKEMRSYHAALKIH